MAENDKITRVNLASPPWQALHGLQAAALAAKNIQELVFIILNRSVEIAPYHRSCLWDMRGGKPVMAGVSGRADVDTRSTLAEQWAKAVGGLTRPAQTRLLSDEDFSDNSRDPWRASQGNLAVRHVLWLPIITHEGLRAGLWLERWDKGGWTKPEIESLAFLAKAYAHAYEKQEPQTFIRRLKSHTQKRLWKLIAAAVVLLLLFLLRLPLRTVAPCEVAPKDPIVVTAPLDGVVEKVLVRPGQEVTQGQALVVYDKTVISQKLEVARKQVQAAEAALDAARVQAFRDQGSRTSISLLENYLAQERIKLQLIQKRYSQLIVQAPAAGSVIIEKPWEWRGKPVQVGQRVMMIFTTRQSELRIWIPEDQRIAYNRRRPVDVLLNAMPDQTLHASLVYVGRSMVISPDGIPSFTAEAQWSGGHEGVRIGFRGTAILYGDDVTVAYWLIRRPWAALRRFVGL